MTMKNGFSTINRLLGKNRESSGNLSKSTTNLSVTKSTVNINDSSQVHQNRITPLPIATSNAPFEQTFRITVLLPRDQLYVARLGAKVLLHKLLQLVCENKQLDPEKYEFQHPADTSQIFSCDLTIGAVGLSEIRLCNKSEYNNTFRSDDVTSRRNSFSSSKYSRNSKIISNTPSLYSSRNSLNSMSSSGIDSNFRNNITEVGGPKHLAPVIPVRKKRLAPRPPSQNLSLENDSALRTKTSELPSNTITTEIQQPILHTELVSSLNSSHTLEQRISGSNDLIKSNISIDCNGNTKGSLKNNGLCITQCQESSSEAINTTDVVVPKDSFYSQSSIENISCPSQPEPSPRRKVQTPPKKPVPVAPPRSTKSLTEKINETQSEEKTSRDFTMLQEGPVALPRSASSSSLISEPIEQSAVNSKNESEIVINQSPSIESNLILQTPDVKSAPVESINSQSKGSVLDDGEEQIDRSWNSSSTQSSAETKHKLFIESSSEDDEMIKVYDLKLGKKTIVKTLSNHKTSEVIDGIKPNIEIDQPRSPPGEDFVKSQNFSDNDSSEKDALLDISVVDEIKKDDFPSTHSSILEDEKVDITVESSQSYISSTKEENQDNSIIEDKLKQQIEEQRITEETNIKCENVAEKPITEVNKEVKGINNIKPEIPLQITQMKQPQKATTLSENKKPTIDPDEMGKQESKVINTTIINSTQAITKQEPLISTLERLVGDEELLDEQNFKLSPIQTKPAIQTKPDLPNRSSSFLSLVQLESTNQRNYTTDEYLRRRRRSSSELSILESPSLQSIGVIKSILSSRKNSLCGREESNRTPPTECDIQSMEEPSPKSNNILKTNKLKTVEQEKVYRYSGPPNIHFSTWSERPKVQVSIKNEQDCVFNGSKVGGQNTTSTVNRGDLAPQRTNPNLKSAPFVKDLVKNGTEKIALKDTTSNFSSEKEMDKTQNPSTTSTIPKFILGDRTSNPWNVLSTTSITSAHNNRPLTKPLLRSTSMTRTVSTPVIKQTQPAFGQGTLRKTGYKEKIVPLPDTDVDADVSKPIPFTLKNQTNPQATPKIVKNTIRTEVPVSNVPDAPPPPPIIRAVVTKQKTNNKTQISLTVDPRDQLLSAIRNFKRDELKNANI